MKIRCLGGGRVILAVRADEAERQFAFSHGLKVLEKGQMDGPRFAGLTCHHRGILEKELDVFCPDGDRRPASVLVVLLFFVLAARTWCDAARKTKRKQSRQSIHGSLHRSFPPVVAATGTPPIARSRS